MPDQHGANGTPPDDEDTGHRPEPVDGDSALGSGGPVNDESRGSNDPAGPPDASEPSGAHGTGDGGEADRTEAADELVTSHRERTRTGFRGPGRRTTRILLRVGVAIVGAVIGLMLGANTTAAIGPVTTNMSLTMLGGGGAEIAIPPLGSLDVDAYDGPLSLRVELASVDEQQATDLVQDPRHLLGLENRVVSDLQDALTWLIIKSTVCALAGAGLLALLTFRRVRDTVIALGVCVALLLGSAGLGVVTWRPQALDEPTYTGLLTRAPTLVGDVQNLVTNFSDYRTSLTKMVGNISELYATVSTLPSGEANDDSIRLLHVSDVHLNPTAFDLMSQLIEQFDITAVLDTGDIVDWGSQPESTFVTGIAELGVPYVYIRGNHDSAGTAQQVAAQPNAVVLEKSTTSIEGIDVVGIGDPRFTPDKSTDTENPAEQVETAGESLATYIGTLPEPPDVAMVHDPASAEPLAGEVPLVLAGHTHEREVSDLGEDTLLMTEGSTGGAGLRGLEHEEPTPLAATVLYFHPESKRLTAYDEVTLGGLGETEVTIQRHVVESGTGAEAEGAPPPRSPVVPSGSPTSPVTSPPPTTTTPAPSGTAPPGG